jgi:hypothetical protein
MYIKRHIVLSSKLPSRSAENCGGKKGAVCDWGELKSRRFGEVSLSVFVLDLVGALWELMEVLVRYLGSLCRYDGFSPSFAVSCCCLPLAMLESPFVPLSQQQRRFVCFNTRYPLMMLQQYTIGLKKTALHLRNMRSIVQPIKWQIAGMARLLLCKMLVKTTKISGNYLVGRVLSRKHQR